MNKMKKLAVVFFLPITFMVFAPVPGYAEPTLAITVISSETTIEEQPVISGGSIRDGVLHWNVEMLEPLAGDSFAL